jgi:ribosome-associated translation inhibitor RaiA
MMDPVITARHCDISADLRTRALSIAERLGAVARRPMESAVVFDTVGNRSTAELRLHLAQGDVLVAGADGPDHRTALDRAEAKLRTQLGRAARRFRSARHADAALKPT